jgi:acetyl-CoA carboxylase biotin carboxyl carrier protein
VVVAEINEAKMNAQEVKDFLKSIKDTDIEEMRYQNGKDSLYFKRNVTPMVHTDKKIIVNKNKKNEDRKQTLITIKSTMVGTFVNTQDVDDFTFIKEGDNVIIGQKIGQLEAMKLIKDIRSNIKGKIVKVFISNGQPVEYGQELFLVDTSK